jgi:DegV family protein with EDD domain
VGVRVVTDSSAVVPRAWVDSFRLHMIPLQIAWADGTVMDHDPPYSEVVDELSRRPPPLTAAPSPGIFAETFEQLLAEDDAILVVTPPTEFSTTFQSATLAARNVEGERIRVLDGRTAAAGQGIVAAEAARAATSEATLDQVCDRALAVASRVEIWATLTSLDRLRRSGRVPSIAAVGAGALHLQPIVRYAGGNPSPVAVTRNARRATDRILRAWESSIPSADRSLRALAFHCARGEEADALHDRVRARVPGAEAQVVEVPASLAAHTGPGLLGLAWHWD